MSEDLYIDLLNRREFQQLEALATAALARCSDPLSALMVAHARIRQGRFESALPALYDLERVDPDKGPLVRDLASMCERELDQLALETDASVRERVAEMDLWSDRELAPSVAGRAMLTTGESLEFRDMLDTDDGVGRRLLVFGLDRAWRIPFEAMASFELAQRRAIFFDDIWAPVRIILRAGESVREITGRAPAFYSGSLNHENAQIAAGQKTFFDRSRGVRHALGLRDYELARSGGQQGLLIGIHQLAQVVFA